MAAELRGSPVDVPEIPAPEDIVAGAQSYSSEEWHACGPPPPNRQGWKLYVPLTLLNAAELARLVVPLAVEHGHHVKYVRDATTLRKLNAGMFGYPQIGKSLVIYMPLPDAVFIHRLRIALSPYIDECPVVPCARPFGGHLPLYYRYGSYRDGFLTFGEARVEDDRASLEGAVPKGVSDELARYTSPVPEEPGVAAFLRRYPVLEALRQEGKCGVFHALDMAAETFTEVALKVGYHRGQLQVDGTDGNSFLRHELSVYRLLSSRGLEHLAPRLLDSLDVPRKVVLVLEFVHGESLLAHRLSGSLTVDHLQRAWAMLGEFHAGGVRIGDAKIANVLADQDGSLSFVDFEGAGELGDHSNPVRTFFVREPPSSAEARDKAHFLASVLFPYEPSKYSWSDRHVSLSDLAATANDDVISDWARAHLSDVRD